MVMVGITSSYLFVVEWMEIPQKTTEGIAKNRRKEKKKQSSGKRNGTPGALNF